MEPGQPYKSSRKEKPSIVEDAVIEIDVEDYVYNR